MPELDLAKLRKSLHGGAYIGPGEGLALLDLVKQVAEALDGELRQQRTIHRSDGLIECTYCAYDDDHAEDCPVGALAAYQQAQGEP